MLLNKLIKTGAKAPLEYKMKIKKITWQLRRDFTAIFECEHCGFEEKRDGYDDAFFHQNVIPSMECDKCGKTAGDDYRPLAPKYNGGQVI